MQILFVIKNTANLRTLTSVVRLLAERGHDVRIACRDVKSGDSRELLDDLTGSSSRIELVTYPFARASGWTHLAASLRRTIDYLRYLEPVYRDATKLRARAEQEAPPSMRVPARLVGLVPHGAAAARRALQSVERCLEPPAQVTSFLEQQRPDVLMITPLIGFGTPQADIVRAAKRLGIPVSFPVRSWDNLTNKGLLREPPDQVLVWNDLQRAEAVDLHGVPPERVVVTGAPAYDHWFDWRPSRTREEFLSLVRLDPGRPVVLYVGSSGFIAPDEPAFVRRWVEALREHGGPLAEAGLLIRPHPLAADGFAGLELDDRQAVVWPRAGEFPLGEAARVNFYDSIFHSAAVVGVNTSAQIEAAIVGRPVHTVLAADFRDTQAGTLHFRYLADPEFGHLRVAGTLEEHAEQLELSLAAGDAAGLNERFLRRFVRPFGLDVPATPLAADSIEALTRSRRRPESGPSFGPAVRTALRPLAERQARNRRRAKQEVAGAMPLEELKRAARKAVRAGVPVVAGPWAEDEVGELLYWIPFLRWATRTSLTLADRLVVVARSSSSAWYAGLPCRVVEAESLEHDPEGLAALVGTSRFERLEPGLVAGRRHALAGHDPNAPLLQRRLDFELLRPAAELPDLPADAVAVGGVGAPLVDAATIAVKQVALHAPVLALSGADDLRGALDGCRGIRWLDDLTRDEEAAVLAGAGCFLGGFGPSATVAVLAGAPAVVLGDGDRDDVRLARALPVPPFGALQTAAVGEAEAAAERVLRLCGRDATVATPL
jgi:hypothetical protein